MRLLDLPNDDVSHQQLHQCDEYNEVNTMVGLLGSVAHQKITGGEQQMNGQLQRRFELARVDRIGWFFYGGLQQSMGKLVIKVVVDENSPKMVGIIELRGGPTRAGGQWNVGDLAIQLGHQTCQKPQVITCARAQRST